MISCNADTVKADPLVEKAMNELREVLHKQSQFIKVHAAEYLIWLGDTDEVRKVYLSENDRYQTQTPYRIGIWRVLAQTEKKSEDRMQWINKVFDVYADKNAPDRLHATETLAKLQQSPLEKYPGITQATLSSDNRNLNTYALWAVSYSSDSAMKKNRSEFLHLAKEDSNQIIRKISAFILRKIGGLTSDEWTGLADKALSEPVETGMRYSLLNTAFVTSPDESKKTGLFQTIRQEMVKNSNHFSMGERIELALSLADRGTEEDLPVLQSMLNNENISGIYEADSKEGADIRATAAYAIVKIKLHSK
jgi:HEAT repeat protein